MHSLMNGPLQDIVSWTYNDTISGLLMLGNWAASNISLFYKGAHLISLNPQ